MRTLIFPLIASITLVHGTPLINGILGGGNGLLGEGNGHSNVNPNGVAHPLNGGLGPPLCTLGVGCECGGLLSGVKAVGNTVNALGLGVDCHGVVIGGRGGHSHDDDDDEESEKKKGKKKKDKKKDKKEIEPTEVTEAPTVTETPKVTEPPIKSGGCFDIEKPIRDVDDKENGSTPGDGDNDSDDCGCDDTDCDGCDCDGDDGCDCDDSDCKDFDCSQCDLEL